MVQQISVKVYIHFVFIPYLYSIIFFFLRIRFCFKIKEYKNNVVEAVFSVHKSFSSIRVGKHLQIQHHPASSCPTIGDGKPQLYSSAASSRTHMVSGSVLQAECKSLAKNGRKSLERLVNLNSSQN